MKKSLEISLEKAREIYKKGDETFNAILLENFKKEELEEKEVLVWSDIYLRGKYYWLGEFGEVESDMFNCAIDTIVLGNTLPSKILAEAFLARMQIELLISQPSYNGEPTDVWLGQIDGTDYTFYQIYYNKVGSDFRLTPTTFMSCGVSFKNKDSAEKFLAQKENIELLEKAKWIL
jgi:hypothetical protein